MFLRNAWYVAAARDELSDKPLARTLLDEPVALYRDVRGVAVALEDRCCHRGAPLSLGWATEKGLMCGYHGLVFDATGACVDIPGHTAKIPSKARVRSYPAVEKGAFVWIWMGDPALAEPADVLLYPADDPDFPRGHAMLYVKANYEMVIDNLMDLSHLAYLHKGSIGSSGGDTAKAELTVEKTATGVKFHKALKDVQVHSAQSVHFTGKIDRWHDFEFVAPSLVVQRTSTGEAGEHDKGVHRVSLRILHAATPETIRTTHYFYSFADDSREGYRRPGQGAGDLLRSVLLEDVFMMEQQQTRLEGYDRSKLINIPSDGARVTMETFLEQKIREEQTAGAPLARAG
jgi:vanillate O-demethylase monooxygenase subunit